MRHQYTVLIGKAVKYLAKLRGGGSALPGLFVEKIDADFVKRSLSDLPHGVVVISGTNGKTTTTKMVVELLESAGLKVFTNRTGSNFSRGVAAALLGEVDIKGNLDADIAVLELDEAHAVSFVKSIPPKYSLLLNVMRDQLDRFGEIDKTAKLLETIAQNTTEAVVLNREDPYLTDIASRLSSSIKPGFFGLATELKSVFPGERIDPHPSTHQAVATLDTYSDDQASFTIEGQSFSTNVKLSGIYNLFNAAAAISLVKTILPEFSSEQLISGLASINPAFGRGEKLTINGQPLELVLVKNPSGFRLGLKSFPADNYATMIAINDNYADGRDMSWLWDVEFDSLKSTGVGMVRGIRAHDMALRLQYDEVPIDSVVPNLKSGLGQF